MSEDDRKLIQAAVKAADILCERLPAINAERLRKKVIYQLIEEVIKEVQDERNDE